MSKHNLIIYSLLLAAVPISVLADSSTTSAATVGMFSPPTAPSVGHKPGQPRAVFHFLNEKGQPLTYDDYYAPFPGMTLKRYSRWRVSDPDTQYYQASETFTEACTYYLVNRDGSQHKIKREKPCEYRFDFREEHVGSKLKLELYNETDMASASGYTPVPTVSVPFYFESKVIVNMPPDLAIVDIDKSVLLPGESAIVKLIFKDKDNNPINDLEVSYYFGHNGEWDISSVKKGSNPGEYIQTVTYKGANGSRNPVVFIEYDYLGKSLLSKEIRITGK
ncbi:ZirS family two-partner secretion-like system exoprotein [Salmonella sp. 741265054_HSA]|uniref:ZirS family two-partner secretion-like system exoprotein n=1 Tax=unclassified Salmonella TaxID=2614656 RepID=UPI00397F0736|nr:hypothetical protein [Salmonella enterica]EHH3298488.1 hypothetical protein [Salmonella enterica]